MFSFSEFLLVPLTRTTQPTEGWECMLIPRSRITAICGALRGCKIMHKKDVLAQSAEWMSLADLNAINRGEFAALLKVCAAWAVVYKRDFPRHIVEQCAELVPEWKPAVEAWFLSAPF